MAVQQRNLRLVDQAQFVAREGQLEGIRQLQGPRCALLHVRRVEAVAVSAFVFDPVHGRFCAAHQIGGRDTVVGVEGQPHGCGQYQLLPVEQDGARQDIEHLVDQVDRTVLVRVGASEDKVVARIARNDVLPLHDVPHAMGGFAQDAVSGCMAIGVVDVLEEVQVQPQQGHGFDLAPGLCERELELFHQQGPVGQAGELIEFGQVLDPFGGRFFVAHILLVGQVVRDGTGLVADRVDQGLFVVFLSIFAPVDQLPLPWLTRGELAPHVLENASRCPA